LGNLENLAFKERGKKEALDGKEKNGGDPKHHERTCVKFDLDPGGTNKVN